MNFAITIPLFLFVSVAFGVIYSVLFLLFHKIGLLKIHFLPLFLFSTLLYVAVTFLAGYFYLSGNPTPTPLL
jgi:hypothetical protein